MKLLPLLGCAAMMAAGTSAAESSWFAAEDAVPTALLPQPSAMPRLSGGGAVVATRTPEAYVVLSGASGESFHPIAPAQPVPDGSIVLADVANDGAAPVELSIGFRAKGGGGFGWKARLPPGRRTLELSPADCAPADGLTSLPSNRWANVSELALGVKSADEGTTARIVLRDLSAVEAHPMRSRGGQPWPEERELLPADMAPLVFASRPGEFKGKPDARSVRIPVDGRRLFDGVAFHGTGGKLVLTVRATTPPDARGGDRLPAVRRQGLGLGRPCDRPGLAGGRAALQADALLQPLGTARDSAGRETGAGQVHHRPFLLRQVAVP